MSNFQEIDPTTFIDQTRQLPANGRGAWTSTGIGFSRYYRLSPKGTPRAGSEAEKSLDHWAVSAGIQGLREVLADGGYVDRASSKYVGNFGTELSEGVKAFQAANSDPAVDVRLVADGVFGPASARALFTPLVDAAGAEYSIPNDLLRGVVWHESWLDPGAVGYYIYYKNYDGTTRYGGVDRGIEQNNSKANPSTSWATAYDPRWAVRDAGKRLRTAFNRLQGLYPNRDEQTLWDAAIVSHNSPANGLSWAKLGAPPTTQAAEYVASVRKSVY